MLWSILLVYNLRVGPITDINFLFNTWSLVVTLGTTMFNFQTVYIVPTQHIDVLCMDFKHFFLPYTSTSWFFNRDGEHFELQTDSLTTADYVSPLKGYERPDCLTECIVLMLRMLEVTGSNPDHYKVFLVSFRLMLGLYLKFYLYHLHPYSLNT